MPLTRQPRSRPTRGLPRHAPALLALALASCASRQATTLGPSRSEPAPPAAPPAAATRIDSTPPAPAPAATAVVPEASVAAPALVYERTERVEPAGVSVAALRVLFAGTPVGVTTRGGVLVIPMLCYDARAHRVLSDPACAARVPMNAVVAFPGGATAHTARRAPAPCAYSSEIEQHGWRPSRGNPGQPGVVLDHVTGTPGAFAVWPDGLAWIVPPPATPDAAPPDYLPMLPPAERDALRAALHAEGAVTPQVVQALSQDLDGDGIAERIYNTVTPASDPEAENSTGPTENVCVLSGSAPVHGECFGAWGLSDPRVVGALDLDGDHVLELLVHVPGNDHDAYQLFRRDGARWTSLGSNNCGE